MATVQRATKEWAPWFTFTDRETVECVWCQKTYKYVRRRAFEHYGFGAKGPRVVCTKAPMAVKRRFASCGGCIPPKMTDAEIYGTTASGSRATPAPCLSQSMPDKNIVQSEHEDVHIVEGPTKSTAQPSFAGSCAPRSFRQQELSEAYQIGKRKELDAIWAAFFYEANVAFNVVRHPAFIAAVRATSNAGFDYEPPTYNAMRTTLIEPKKRQITADIETKTSKCIEIYGATICSDGWDNVTHRPLMNVMLVCPAGDVFLGSVDTTGNKKTKDYIANRLKEYIEVVGPNKVTQICSDNASAMLGAMDEVVTAYRHIYKQRCCAHILDLLMEDWGKEPFSKTW